MSRFCMYCGRELNKSEQCDCAMSAAARAGKYTAQNPSGTSESKNQTRKEKSKAERKEKKEQKKRSKPYNSHSGNFFVNFKNLIVDFLKNPIYTVKNPGIAGKGETLVLTALLGITVSLVVFFSGSTMNRGILSFMSSIFGFKGSRGFADILNMFLNMFTFTVFSYIQFFVLTGIFYMIQRFILRLYTEFWDIARRFSICSIPVIITGIAGIFFAFFSMQTVIMLIAAALIFAVILSFEAVKSMWHGLLEDRAIYLASVGYFVYFLICSNLLLALINA